CVRDQDLGIEIFSVALEARIVGHLEHHMDVAARATTGAHISHAAQRHVLTGSDAAGNVHGNVSIGADAAVSPALLAGRTDNAAFAFARRARRDRYELSEKRALRALDLTRAAAARTH